MKTLTQQARRLARNVSWLLLQEVLIRCIGLVTAIYLARVLSASEYGALGLALAIIGILSKLVEAGTGSRATRITALDSTTVRETYAQISGMRLALAIVLIGCLIILAPGLSRTFSFSGSLLILCSFLLLRPALAVIWAFRGLDQMHVSAIAGIAEKAIALAGLVLLVHGQGNDLLWVPVVEMAAALIMVFWLRAQLARIYPGLAIAFRYRDWPEIARESLPLSLAALLGSVYLHGAVLLLGWLSTAAAAADFLIAQKLMLSLAVLWLVISRSAFPSTSRMLSKDVPAALHMVTSLLRYYLLAIAPTGLLLALYANEVLALLFGATYSNSGPVLIALLAALPFLAISHSLQLLLRAIPKPRAVLAGRVVSALVLLLCAACLIPRYGATGAAVAVVAGESAGMLLLFLLVKQLLGAVPWNARCGVPIAAGVAAAGSFVMAASWPVYLGLPLAAMVYVLGVLLLKAISLDELRSIPPVLAAAFRKNEIAQKP